MFKIVKLSKIYPLGKIAGLKLSARQSVIPAFLILWLILAAIAIWLIRLPILGAIIGGLIAAALHFLSEFCHQLGHGIAARMTGYPMSGVLFWGPLSTSLYPPKERKLPASIHIQRALGGPTASFLLALVGGVLVLVFSSLGGTFFWVSIFFFLDNLLVFTLGSFLPLGFSDGSTLLYWSKQRKSKA
jgi:hypothetical protein